MMLKESCRILHAGGARIEKMIRKGIMSGSRAVQWA